MRGVARRPFRSRGYDHGGDRFPSRPPVPAPALRAALSRQPAPPTDTPSRDRRMVRSRNRHENDTVPTWFLHGFSRPQHAQPPLTSPLAPPEKTLFSATATNLPNEPTRALPSIFYPPSSPP